MENNQEDRDKVKIGLVGAGQVGNIHLRSYQKIRGAEVTAISDIDERRAKAAAENYGVDYVYTDYRELLENEEIDAVDVCVHNNLHPPIVIDSLESKKDVFCEKPMAGSYRDARRMYERAREENRNLSIQNRLLYSKETKAAKELIEDGKLGNIYYGRASSRNRRRGIPFVEGYGSSNFVRKEISGGGAIYDLGVYVIGQILHLMGLPGVKRIRGKTYQNVEDRYGDKDEDNVYKKRWEESGFNVEDTGLGFVEFENGSVLFVQASWAMYAKDERSLVVGTNGGIKLGPLEYFSTVSDIEMDASLDLDEYDWRKKQLKGKAIKNEEEFSFPPLYHWVEALRGNEETPPTAEIALKSMLIMEGIYFSNDLGREVTAGEVMEKSESTALRA